MKSVFAGALAVMLGATPAAAQGGDAAAGETLAAAECASCHAVTRDAEAKSPEPKAPRFLDVANMPSTTELSLKVFMRTPHRNMPNLILSPQEIDSVAAYILGLRKK